MVVAAASGVNPGEGFVIGIDYAEEFFVAGCVGEVAFKTATLLLCDVDGFLPAFKSLLL